MYDLIYEHPYGEQLDTASIYFNPPLAHRNQQLNGTPTDDINSFRGQSP